ncbi:MAG: hypothetical protein JWO98_555 [Frankiales bacterium]|nr:hypothetical protein [Frankiales bacterium]
MRLDLRRRLSEPHTIGTGVVLGDRYRVVDSWMSFDHHGVFDDGLHIFLERVTEDDDRLKRIAPSYFRD